MSLTIENQIVNIKLMQKYADSLRQEVLLLRKLGKTYSEICHEAREKAILVNKIKHQKYLKSIEDKNKPVSYKIQNFATAKIALAMLCLGEATKSIRSRRFAFGNSNPKIVLLFLNLLKNCYTIDLNKMRCRVQCRSDQQTQELEDYWHKVTKIPKEYFYKTYVDKRTVSKPTLRSEYKGVFVIDYFDKNIQLELESLAELVYNNVILGR